MSSRGAEVLEMVEAMQALAVSRRALGMTQEQLAERVGCSRKSVWAWETGRVLPTRLMFARIVAALDAGRVRR